MRNAYSSWRTVLWLLRLRRRRAGSHLRQSGLKIDYSRVKVIYMNMTDLHWYFPYWDRVQQIRTSQLWVAP